MIYEHTKDIPEKPACTSVLDLKVKFLPIKGKLKKIQEGNDITFWIRLLDFLVSKGWPEYVVIWTCERELLVFEKYLLQDVKNEIQRKAIR